MTSTADTTQHPDVSEISDLTEGLLPPSRTAYIRKHLDGCALCADVRTSLEEIRGVLGTLPGPARMPADIAGRIDAALAAEALLDSTAPAENARVSCETTTVPGPPEPEPAVRTDRPAGHPRSSTGPGRDRPARRRRRSVVIGTVFGLAAAGVSVLLLHTLRPSEGEPSGSTASTTVSAAENAEFSGTALGDRVEKLLTASSVREPETGKEPRARQESSAQKSPFHPLGALDVPPCVQAGTGRTEEPVLAVEEGEYEGKRAYLLVLPHTTDATRVEAYVLDARCTGTGGASEAEILLTHAYPRP